MEEKETLLYPLIALLDQIRSLSTELRSVLIYGFKIEQVKKGTILLYEDKVCNQLWFLANGLLRAYHSIAEKEITSRIMFTGHIVVSPGSFFMQTPAIESIETLTDCTVASLSFQALQIIYQQYPEFNYHTRKITEGYFFEQEQRLYMLRKPDVVNRYTYFIDHYAEWLNHIPQRHIASFLGMTRETFNRVRNNRWKKP